MKKKYNNTKIEIDGILFDSMLEASYYKFLKEEKAAGNIKDFSLQPVFLLIAPFTKYGKKIRKTEYKADFKILNNDGSIEIIDTKGFLTEVFKIKKKLLLSLYDVDFFLVKRAGGKFVKYR